MMATRAWGLVVRTRCVPIGSTRRGRTAHDDLLQHQAHVGGDVAFDLVLVEHLEGNLLEAALRGAVPHPGEVAALSDEGVGLFHAAIIALG